MPEPLFPSSDPSPSPTPDMLKPEAGFPADKPETGSFDFSRLRQQSLQAQHLLKYKDDVEIPAFKRQIGQLQQELQAVKTFLHETSKQEEFVDRRTGILHLDRDNRVLKINAFAQEILGVFPSQAVGRLIQEVGIDKESGRPVFADIDYHLQPEGRESDWEKEIPMPSGEKRYYHLRALLLGGVRIITIADVTDWRLADSRLKAIITASDEGIALVDEAGVIRSVNSRFGKLFGLGFRQFLGMQFHIAAELLQYHFKDPGEFLDFHARTVSDPGVQDRKELEMVEPFSAFYDLYTRAITDEQGRIIGRVWFVSDITKHKETTRRAEANAQDLDVEVKARTAELSIKNEKLLQVTQTLEKASNEMEMELEMAKKVQQGMLPRALPSLPGYDLGSAYTPTGKVSGDFYDFIRLDEDHYFLLMTDVSGHGVPAALVTAMAKMAFDRHARAGSPVTEILRNVNHDLCAAISTDHYLTAFAAILELSTGKLDYSRVCHPYPVLYRKEGRALEHLQMRGGFFLGMFEDNTYTEESTRLHPGDLLFVYTDGINESFNSKDELYGRKRLDQVILRYAPYGADETVYQAQLDKERFSEGRQSLDDITIFAIRRALTT